MTAGKRPSSSGFFQKARAVADFIEPLAQEEVTPAHGDDLGSDANRETTKTRINELAKPLNNEIAKTRDSEIVKSPKSETVKPRNSKPAKSQNSGVAKSQNSEITKTHKRGNAKSQNSENAKPRSNLKVDEDGIVWVSQGFEMRLDYLKDIKRLALEWDVKIYEVVDQILTEYFKGE